MDRVLLAASDLRAGEPIPWRIFDADGRLLLREGHVFPDADVIEAFVRREVYRAPTAAEAAAPATGPPAIDPFALVLERSAELSQGIKAIAAGRCASAPAWVASFVANVESLAAMHVDAVLGGLLLIEDLKYSMSHSWMTATLCDLVARRLTMPDPDRRTLVAAAFTSNVAMEHVQDEFSAQPGPLTPDQAAIVKAHPARGAELLAAAGVQDEYWLTVTRQHHERLDGSGYPAALRDSDIGVPARLLALADIYAAIVLPRSYRDGIHAKLALREIFAQRGSKIDAELASVFIKEVGVFPPGVIVRLAGGETAVVVRRNPRHANKPIVSSVLNAYGKPFDRPRQHDSAEASPYAIADVLPRQALPFKLRDIWGYTK